MPRFLIDYRDPETGGLASATVDAKDFADAERRLDWIGCGNVIGELIEEGVLDGIHHQVGTA